MDSYLRSKVIKKDNNKFEKSWEFLAVMKSRVKKREDVRELAIKAHYTRDLHKNSQYCFSENEVIRR